MLSIMLAAVAPLGSSGEDAAVASPSAEARRLQGAWKRAAADERRELAVQFLTLGADGGRRLHAIARGEFLQLLPRYTSAYQRSAAKVLRDRLGKADPTAEIATLRKTIRDVAAAADLTKEMIEQTSDPALARLEELLVVTPAEVLAADEGLAVSRAELLMLADWAERAADLVPETERGKLGPLPARDETAAELDAADALAAVLALPLSPGDRQTLAANVALARQLDPEEARGIQRLNQIRVLAGLPAQVIDLKLVAACRVHSTDMGERGFFAHESPVSGRETPWKRAEAAGTSAGAENIAAGTATGVGAIQMWWHSPGHHKNMLGGQKRTGLGRFEQHWTQLFG
jgi:uncharacterized protein YkwD